MAEITVEEKCKRLVGLIAQSPPGEVNDVINDIRAIVGNDEALMPHVLPSLRAYNLSQLHPVEHPAEDSTPEHVSLLSHATVLPSSSKEGKERYIDAEAKRSFAFDHVTLAISEYEPYELPEEEAAFRAELYKSLSAYTKNHFPSGYCSVSTSQFPLLPPAPTPPAPVETAPEPEDAPQSKTAASDDDDITGDVEPVPTPAVDDVPEKKEEIDQPGGLEKVDEKVEEVKEEEEKEEREEQAKEEKEEKEKEKTEDTKEEAEQVVPTSSIDIAEDESEGQEGDTRPAEDAAKPVETPSTEAPQAATTDAPIPERKQERVENPTYTLEIVGNRYNPANFWTGRWRTQWVVDQAAGTVTGNIIVDVHYYEQGNVQLSTKHSASFPYPSSSGSQSVASQIVTSISKLETNYHLELNDVYSELGDKAFKALRRALPITRQKMDWEKVSGYTLGADLTKARA